MYMYICNLCLYINVKCGSLKWNLKLNMLCKSLKSYNNDNNKKIFFNIIYCDCVKNDLFGKVYFVKKKIKKK